MTVSDGRKLAGQATLVEMSSYTWKAIRRVLKLTGRQC